MTDAGPRRRRRRHAAIGTRVAATGIGATGLLGLTAAFTSTAQAGPDSTDANPAGVDPVSAPSVTDVLESADGAPVPLTAVPVKRRVIVVAPPSGGGSTGSSRSSSTGSASANSTASRSTGSRGSAQSSSGQSQVSSPRPSPAPAPAASSGGSR